MFMFHNVSVMLEPALGTRTIEGERLLSTRLLTPGYQRIKMSTLKKFCVRKHDLVNPYSVAVSRLKSDVFVTVKP